MKAWAYHLGLAGLCWLGVGVATRVAPAWEDLDPATQVAHTNDQMRKAIQLLGSDQFEQRELAKQELIDWGAAAWELLREAQSDPDLEVSLQAKYLLQRLLVSGPTPEDPREAHALLDKYASQPEIERLRRIEELAKLTNPAVLRTLARIIQFEQSEWLSRRGAVAVLRREEQTTPTARRTLAEILEQVTASGDRWGLVCLRAYAQTLRRPQDLQLVWDKLLTAPPFPDEEMPRDQPLPKTPGRSTGQRAPELQAHRMVLQWYAEALVRMRKTRAAQRIMREFVECLPNDREQWVNALDWLIAWRGWDAIDQLEQKNLPREDPHFAYRLAQAALLQGHRDRALDLAKQTSQRRHAEVAERIEMGTFLVEQNLFEFAQGEYQAGLNRPGLSDEHRVYLLESLASLHRAQGEIAEAIRIYEQSLQFALESSNDTTPVVQARTQARIQLAEMLHDQGQDLRAAEVLQPLAEPTDAWVEEAERAAEMYEISPKARREFFLAEHARNQQDLEAARRHLTAGHQHDPEDVDILIALFHLPNHPDRAQVRQSIRQVASDLRAEITESSKILHRTLELDEEEEVRRLLARRLNIYAWLVGNTEGDYADAVRCSVRSLELSPGQAGYMDTLARCYFAVNDEEQALRYQEMAVELDPHSGQMNQQLKIFRQSFAQARRPHPPAPPTNAAP